MFSTRAMDLGSGGHRLKNRGRRGGIGTAFLQAAVSLRGIAETNPGYVSSEAYWTQSTSSVPVPDGLIPSHSSHTCTPLMNQSTRPEDPWTQNAQFSSLIR